jgi:hypothetical protein
MSESSQNVSPPSPNLLLNDQAFGICKSFNHQRTETQRAGTAARPYAEIFLSIAQAHSHRLERKKKTLPAASRHGKGPIFTNKQTKQTNNLAELEANHIP